MRRELLQTLSDNVEPHLPQTWGFCDSAKILKRKLGESQSPGSYRLPSIDTQGLGSCTITVSLQKGMHIFAPRKERSYSFVAFSPGWKKKWQSYWKMNKFSLWKTSLMFLWFLHKLMKTLACRAGCRMKPILIATESTQCWSSPSTTPKPCAGLPSRISWQIGSLMRRKKRALAWRVMAFLASPSSQPALCPTSQSESLVARFPRTVTSW